jgi:hypothetical protein
VKARLCFPVVLLGAEFYGPYWVYYLLAMGEEADSYRWIVGLN